MPRENAPSPGFRPSLRLKLMLWMVLIFLVVQLSLVFVFQVYQRQSINRFYDARLIDHLESLIRALRERLPSISDHALHDTAASYRTMLLQQKVVIEVFDERGVSIAASDPPGFKLPASIWEQVRNAREPEAVRLPASVLREPDAPGARSAAGWTVGSDGKRYLVLLAWSDIYAQEMLGLLFGVVFISIPIGLIAMVVSAYAISGVAVRPILAMRQMARGLEPANLGERVPDPQAGAEVESLRQDLERTRKKLETAFAVQETFMANVSHELKTPIAVLMTEAQLLKVDGAGNDVRAFVGSSMDELDKLGRMVDSFLLLTRVRHGKATVPNQELCLARDIMSQSYEGCAQMAAQHGVRLTVRLPDKEDLDVGVHGNCDLLRLVLDNLIRNAIRFSPKGKLVEIDGQVASGQLIIRVRDSGPGIPAELLPRIFDRFAQSREEQRRGRGHGLGLEIALGIAEMHGGSIAAANRPEGGCQFSVTLPVTDHPSPEPSHLMGV
jgi:signal transduction histidine kinase